MALWLWLRFGVIGLLRRRTAAFLLLVDGEIATAHRGSQGRTAALGFFPKHGTGLWASSGFGTGYLFRGEVSIEIDFLLNLEFYVRVTLILILGLCIENCFQFSRYVYFSTHIDYSCFNFSKESLL